MIGHTKAFAAYRVLSQAHLNFVVLVCHAVPALRADLAVPTPALSNEPDHFKTGRNSKVEMGNHISNYQKELARSTLITVFSYFESYVKDALNEIVEFHGGNSAFKKLAKQRASKFVVGTHPGIQSDKRKLQDRPSPSKLAKYQKYGKILETKGFRFPTELFAHFGVSQILPKLGDDRRGMRAAEIPSLLEECLLFPITAADRRVFEEIRSSRNKIAHGRATAFDLPKSLQHSSSLHALAAKVDRHIVEHFLVVQAV